MVGDDRERWIAPGEDIGRNQFRADSGRTWSPGLWVVDVAGGSPARVTGFGGGIRDLAWSPDSRRLAVIAAKDDREEVWTCGIDGSEPTRVSGDLRSAAQLAWTADGCVAFIARPDGDEEPAVWSVDPVGGHPRRLTEPGFAAAGFAFLPDGRLAVVRPDRAGRALGRHRHLYVDGRCLTTSVDRSLVADVTNDAFPSQDLPRLRSSTDDAASSSASGTAAACTWSAWTPIAANSLR